jgi:hypothetical protein
MIAEENARLTHINQGSLVQAITGLTQVLSVGLNRPPLYPSRFNTTPHPVVYEDELVHPLYHSATTHAYGVDGFAATGNHEAGAATENH